MNILITGGAGFIGLNFVNFILKNTDYEITIIDALTYASHPEEINKLGKNPRVRFIQANIINMEEIKLALDRVYEVLVHFAAESHVDRSIKDGEIFIQTNIIGTFNMIQVVMNGFAKKMIHVSTDEVYGTLEKNDTPFTEHSPISPNNPYSASKASSDLIVRSYFQTFGLPLITTRCSNNFGPFQNKEKYIPTIIYHALQEKKIPVYGDGLQIRDWLFVEDHCRAIANIIKNGKSGEVYNIGGGNEKTNIEVVKQVLAIMGKPESLIDYVTDRVGHDRRYAIDSSKLQSELGWIQQHTFQESLEETVKWYIEKFGDKKI
ncbi:dTDP-glucose 4,6-dehydratase [Gottfriedia solisilvae]|uniref:dTDP-glucose 4,6-dehydratase n=1 Tax=Gottfriedia solisilvae TaxID=1516104 RepID=A0A8J3AC38_9BACI|nr:dTDP-glucose 4,6-dehydratase [Gottfriedia solisilvae]GGI10297.1 dTDP-glucose 4,6-dehydratase [Gottfriedia solisilvae]